MERRHDDGYVLLKGAIERVGIAAPAGARAERPRRQEEMIARIVLRPGMKPNTSGHMGSSFRPQGRGVAASCVRDCPDSRSARQSPARTISAGPWSAARSAHACEPSVDLSSLTLVQRSKPGSHPARLRQLRCPRLVSGRPQRLGEGEPGLALQRGVRLASVRRAGRAPAMREPRANDREPAGARRYQSAGTPRDGVRADVTFPDRQ